MPSREEIIINNFIKKIMKESRKCNHCALCYFPGTDNTFCFFGYNCLIHDFHFFKEDDEQ